MWKTLSGVQEYYNIGKKQMEDILIYISVFVLTSPYIPILKIFTVCHSFSEQEAKTLRLHDIHTLVHKLPPANFNMLDLIVAHLRR